MKKFDKEFDETEDFDSIPDELDPTHLGTTITISNQGFKQEMVQQINKNLIKIAKLKLKLLKNEKKQIKQYIKQNLLTKGTKEATK